jgi:phage shock protein A
MEDDDMALLGRVSRLITADVHAMLDQLEEPRALLRQSIRDMEDRLAALEARIRRIESEITKDDKRLDALGHSVTEADAKLDLCFADGNEALARRVVRHKLEAVRLAASVRSVRDELVAELASLTSLAARQRDELECMRQKAALFLDHDADTADAPGRPGAHVDDADIEIALLAEREARQRS